MVVVAAFGHAFGVRVDGPGGPRVLKVLRFDGPNGPRIVVAAGAAVYRGPLRGPGAEGMGL
jgi:hypothetical protein